MSIKEESKIVWLTCPDCGSKIGIILSVGKPTITSQPTPSELSEEQEKWSLSTGENFEDKLKAAGIDTTLINIEEENEIIRISPKKFLGDLWGPINDVIKKLNGIWIREGKESRWEIKKEVE